MRIEDPAAVSYDDDDLSESDRATIARADEINRRRIAERLAVEVPPPSEYDDDEEDEAPAGKFGVIQVDGQQGEAVGNYKFGSGAAVGAPGDKHLREGTPIHKMRASAKPVASTPQETKPRPHGKQTQVPAEGNVDIGEKLEGGATGDVAEAIAGDDLAELLPNAAQGPAPDGKIKWDKSPHWRTRVKIAMDTYGDQPEMLEQIKAVESPGVVKAIDEALGAR